jgi:hypothetical protein
MKFKYVSGQTIDSELRLLAAVRWSIREHGGEPSSGHVDELLDAGIRAYCPVKIAGSPLG